MCAQQLTDRASVVVATVKRLLVYRQIRRCGRYRWRGGQRRS